MHHTYHISMVRYRTHFVLMYEIPWRNSFPTRTSLSRFSLCFTRSNTTTGLPYWHGCNEKKKIPPQRPCKWMTTSIDRAQPDLHHKIARHFLLTLFIKSSKWSWVAVYVGSTRFSSIGGLGIVTLLSCVQNVGMDPLTCKKDENVPFEVERDSSWRICSCSTSLATLPCSLTPRFKYRVPAKWRDLRARSTMFSERP